MEILEQEFSFGVKAEENSYEDIPTFAARPRRFRLGVANPTPGISICASHSMNIREVPCDSNRHYHKRIKENNENKKQTAYLISHVPCDDVEGSGQTERCQILLLVLSAEHLGP